jgi:hypothetical protein
MLPTKLRIIWPSGFRGEELKKSVNQKQESPAWPPQAIHVYDCMLSKKIFFCVEREITLIYI